MKEWRFPPVPGAPEPPAPSAPRPEPVPLVPNEPEPASMQPARPEPPARPRPLRRVVLWAAGGLALALIALLVIFAIRLHPWIAMPSEPRAVIEQRWHKVEELAQDKGVDIDESLLLEAAKAFRGMPPPGNEKRVQRSTLSEEQNRALDTFVRWHTSRGGFVRGSCKDDDLERSRQFIPMFRLGQMALLAADGADDLVLVEAVLDLAAKQRHRGRLVEFAAGGELAQRAAEWSHDRGVAFPPAFRRYRPNVDDLRRAVAREVVCVSSLIEGTGFSRAPPRLGAEKVPRPPLGIVRMGRERLVYQQVHGRLLESSIALGDDWQKIADLYADAAEHHPKSVVLDMTFAYARVARRAGENLARYDELVPRR